MTDERRAKLRALREGKPLSAAHRAALTCQSGCNCAKHTMTNAGQFQPGSTGFTGRHSNQTKKVLAEKAGEQMERKFPGSSRRAALKREQPGAHGSWHWMMSRCFDSWNASYPRYGGRGITVCERWLRFENFYADMGERPEGLTLDRIDNDGNYEPGNCRWATKVEQDANRKDPGGWAARKRNS